MSNGTKTGPATITEYEAKLLTAIFESNFHDGAPEADHAVWLDVTMDESGLSEASRGGVMASLVRKGLAGTEGFVSDPGSQHENDACCWITQEGIEALGAHDTTPPEAACRNEAPDQIDVDALTAVASRLSRSIETRDALRREANDANRKIEKLEARLQDAMDLLASRGVILRNIARTSTKALQAIDGVNATTKALASIASAANKGAKGGAS